MDNTFIDPEDLYENPYPRKKRELPKEDEEDFDPDFMRQVD